MQFCVHACVRVMPSNAANACDELEVVLLYVACSLLSTGGGGRSTSTVRACSRACVKGNCAPNILPPIRKPVSGKYFWQKPDRDTIAGSCFFRRNVLLVGGGAIAPPFLTSSVTSAFTSHCTVRVLYAYLKVLHV